MGMPSINCGSFIINLQSLAVLERDRRGDQHHILSSLVVYYSKLHDGLETSLLSSALLDVMGGQSSGKRLREQEVMEKLEATLEKEYALIQKEFNRDAVAQMLRCEHPPSLILSPVLIAGPFSNTVDPNLGEYSVPVQIRKGVPSLRRTARVMGAWSKRILGMMESSTVLYSTELLKRMKSRMKLALRPLLQRIFQTAVTSEAPPLTQETQFGMQGERLMLAVQVELLLRYATESSHFCTLVGFMRDHTRRSQHLHGMASLTLEDLEFGPGGTGMLLQNAQGLFGAGRLQINFAWRLFGDQARKWRGKMTLWFQLSLLCRQLLRALLCSASGGPQGEVQNRQLVTDVIATKIGWTTDTVMQSKGLLEQVLDDIAQWMCNKAGAPICFLEDVDLGMALVRLVQPMIFEMSRFYRGMWNKKAPEGLQLRSDEQWTTTSPKLAHVLESNLDACGEGSLLLPTREAYVNRLFNYLHVQRDACAVVVDQNQGWIVLTKAEAHINLLHLLECILTQKVIALCYYLTWPIPLMCLCPNPDLGRWLLVGCH